MPKLISASFDGKQAAKLRDNRNVMFPADQYFTMEALEDGSKLALYRHGDAYSGSFEVSQDGTTWTAVNWADIGSANDFDILTAAFGKSSFSRGEKVMFRKIDKWSLNYWNSYTQIKTPAGKWKAYGDLSKSIKFGNFTNICQMFYLCTGIVDASFLVLPKTMSNPQYGMYGMFWYSSLESGFPPMDISQAGEYTFQSAFKDCRLKSLPDMWAPVSGKDMFRSAFSYSDYDYKNVFQQKFDWHFYATGTSDAEMPSGFMRGMFINNTFAEGTRFFFHFPSTLKYSSSTHGLMYIFYRCTGSIEIHWPKHFADENGFIADGGPFFDFGGSATAHFDL